MEYNFFDGVIEKRQSTNVIRLLGLLIVIVTTSTLIGISGMNLFNFITLTRRLESLHEETARYVEQLEHINTLELRLGYLTSKFHYLDFVDSMVHTEDSFSSILLDELNRLSPNGISITSATFSSRGMNFVGETDTLVTLAQFEHNMRNSQLFDAPVISSVSLRALVGMGGAGNIDWDDLDQEDPDVIEGPYNFNMSATVINKPRAINSARRERSLLYHPLTLEERQQQAAQESSQEDSDDDEATDGD